ncbi:MAG: hypothetical protein HC913_23270 [Microscillaceae bacterium]|nr:hypothetical protein [Microscillaceae bacterium]
MTSKEMIFFLFIIFSACDFYKHRSSNTVKLDSIALGMDSIRKVSEKAADTILYLIYHPNIPVKKTKRPGIQGINADERVSKHNFTKALYIFYPYYGGYYLRFRQLDALSIISFDSLKKLKIRTIEDIEQEIEPLRRKDDSLMKTEEWFKSDVVGGIPFLLPTMIYFNNFKQNYNY